MNSATRKSFGPWLLSKVVCRFFLESLSVDPCCQCTVFANVPERNDVRITIPDDHCTIVAKIKELARSSPAFLVFALENSSEVDVFASLKFVDV